MNWGDERLPQHFWNKVSPCPMTGCWLWTGACNSMGYGNIGGFVRGKGWNMLTHRMAYTALVGPIPDGLVLDHRVCQVPCCCNPAHLEAVTQRINTQRYAESKKTCPHGHPWDRANTYRHKGTNTRQCRACGRLHHQKSKEAKRAALQKLL